MKKTQRKDGLRNIRKQKVSFLSILIIALLGTSIFLGIDYTAVGMRRNGSSLYETLNYRDVEVVSTLLLTEQDLNDLKNVSGVTDAEAVRYTGANAVHGDARENINVVSLTDRINRVELREGRLPETDSECAVEQGMADALSLSVGDSVVLTESNDSAFLRESQFAVTGIVAHPDHTNSVVPDLLYAVVTYDAFDDEALNGCFMRAEVVVEKPIGINRFSEKYDRIVAAVSERIEEISSACLKRRKEGMQTQLKEGFAQLEQAKAEVRDKVRIPFEETFPTDRDNRLMSWASVKEADVENPNETARYFWITENTRVDLYFPLEDFFRSVVRSESIPRELLVSLYQAIKQEAAPLIGTEYDYETIRAAIETAASEAGEGYLQLSEACALWDEGHAQYLEATRDGARWVLLDCNENSSFVQLIMGSGNFAKLKSTFSLMFVLVGVLVILATVGKMVDEQRSQIGTTKALGFFNREILAKYLGFGVSATAIGIALGILIARFALEPFMLGSFGKYYRFDIEKPILNVLPTLIVSATGILLSVVTVWLACTRLLRQSAIVLMSPKIPETKKKEAAGKHRLPLYSRLILRNIRTDLKRVVVTVISVAGCCALVVIGLTVRTAIKGCVAKQYGEITDYDLCVRYDPTATEHTADDVYRILQESGTEFTSVYKASVTYRIDDLQVADLYCGDINEIQSFYHLDDWKTGKPLAATNRGVLLQRRFAEVCNLKQGSTFEMVLGGTKTVTVRVAGVFEHYIGRPIVMSTEYYETLFGESPNANACLVRLGGVDAERLQEKLQTVPGVENISRADSDRSIIEASASATDTVAILFVFMASIMAGVVQLNLTNMYVSQKKRELTIMRINGFTVKEVIGYVLRETVATTAIGIVLGIGAGIGVANRIVRALEQPFLQFDRSVSLLACLFGVAVTVVFTVIVNAIALRKTKHLKLTDMA